MRRGPLLLKRLLRVAYFLEVGLLLILVPWSAFWERNYFSDSLPLLGEIVQNNFMRGAISGLGLVNLSVGFVDLASLMLIRRMADPMRASSRGSIDSELAREE